MIDKKTILALILIMVILLLTPYYQRLISPQRPVVSEQKERVEQPGVTPQQKEEAPVVEKPPLELEEVLPSEGEEVEVVVETDLYRAVLSTHGARIKSWELKRFLIRGIEDSVRVELIQNQGYGNLDLRFFVEGDTLSLGSRTFSLVQQRGNLILNPERPEGEVIFQLQDPEKGCKVQKRFAFYNNKYFFDLEVRIEDFQNLTPAPSYQLVWASGLAPTEPNLREDMTYCKAYALMGKELVEFNVKRAPKRTSLSGSTRWVAQRTKYFTLAMIPQSSQGGKVEFSGRTLEVERGKAKKIYSTALEMPLKNAQEQTDKFTVYLGPLDYEITKSLGVGLDRIIMSSGWYERFFRPFSILILRAFKAMYKLVPNYGVVIILFSIVIKVVLYPLTRKSYTSMKKMQVLQPKLAQLKEKYKNDPQRLSQETMKLYKQYGVNPMGGCLPMLLQMPVFIGLFIVFRSTIQLRGAKFVAWIKDLSMPDTVAHLPFKLPLYGDCLNILPLMMGLAMFLQQRTTVRDPRQAAMGYLMPIFFVLIFNNFPSGLILYWTLFNIFSTLQQVFMKERGLPEPVRKK